jgi:hypothetical protein
VRLRILIPASRLILANQLPSEAAPAINSRITAGQSIGLTIPIIQWVGDHPFTVLATGLTDLNGQMGYLDLAIKANGGLTRKLAERLLSCPETTSISINDHVNDTFSVIIEGPYGDAHEEVGVNPFRQYVLSSSRACLVIAQIHTFDSVLLFAGGVGITFIFPHFVRIALHSRSTICKLVWMVRELGGSQKSS